MRGLISRDEEVNRMGSYYLFASAFGFTPLEVDELDLTTAYSLSLLHEEKIKEDKRNEERMKHGRRF